MPRDQASGRFTEENRQELMADQEEEDEITKALREAETRRQTNGTASWANRSPTYPPRTPMPGIEEEADGLIPQTERQPVFDSMTNTQLEATVEAARKRVDFVNELTELEQQVQVKGRKLFADQESSDEEVDDNLEEVEEMISAFGDGGDIGDNLDALERLHAGISVERL